MAGSWHWFYSTDPTGVGWFIAVSDRTSWGGAMRPIEVGGKWVPTRKVPREVRRVLHLCPLLKQVRRERARAWGLLRRQRWALESGR